MNVPLPLVLSYKGPSPDTELLDWFAEGKACGVVLFRDNCIDESTLQKSVLALRQAAPSPIYVMIDEEGGRVRRLPDAPQSMNDLHSYDSHAPSEVASLYASVAIRLQSLGIDTLLAPVVDVADHGSEWLTSRTFSSDRERVAAMAKAVIPAIQAEGIHACAKHFPGTGRVTLDPHLGPITSRILVNDWRAHERVPFDAAISAGVDMILVGHQVMEGFGETLPACLTRAIPKMLLRRHMGFKGQILTDDLAMGAIARTMPIEESVDLALAAGCDLVLVCNDRESQRRAVSHLSRKGTAA